MNNENCLLAISNLMAIYPLIVMYRNDDTISFMCLLNVSVASFISHLFECHKHGMPGNGLSPKTSYLLNRWDVAGCYVFASRFVWIWAERYGMTLWPLVTNGMWPLLIQFLFSVACLRISEYDKYNADRKQTYIYTHTTWHFSIFIVIGLYYLCLFS